MSLLSNILGKIIPSAKADTKPSEEVQADAAKNADVQAANGIAMPAVDVVAILTAAAAKHTERLDWQHSIVDLMKVINEDSSLASRQQLAKELSYSGDSADSATMNIWLHKQVMQKLAEHGGTLPDSLRH